MERLLKGVAEARYAGFLSAGGILRDSRTGHLSGYRSVSYQSGLFRRFHRFVPRLRLGESIPGFQAA
jgi:hypothetical protein